MATRFGETTVSASLAEAIRHSPAIARFLMERVAAQLSCLSADASIHEVHHSYTDDELDNRETDVLAVYRTTAPHLIWVLLEAKINAPFGVQQPEDYVRRRDTAVCLKRCDRCTTVVVAPRRYLESHQRDVAQFDVAISFEEFMAAASDAADLPSTLLNQHLVMALELFAAGYIPLLNALREEQIAWYDSFVQAYVPHLVPNRTNAGSQSYDRIFPIPGQTRGYITHRIFAGEVMAVFMNRGNLLDEAHNQLPTHGSDGVRLESRRTSLFITLSHQTVLALDKERGFADQENAVRSGIDAVDKLHHWCLEHRAFVGAIATGALGGSQTQ